MTHTAVAGDLEGHLSTRALVIKERLELKGHEIRLKTINKIVAQRDLDEYYELVEELRAECKSELDPSRYDPRKAPAD